VESFDVSDISLAAMQARGLRSEKEKKNQVNARDQCKGKV
jgi:hypothetical protein